MTKLSLTPMQLYRYHSKYYGNYIALVLSVGHKWVHYVAIGYPIALKRAPIGDAKFFTDVGYKGDARAKFAEYGSLMGITKGAHKALNGEE